MSTVPAIWNTATQRRTEIATALRKKKNLDIQTRPDSGYASRHPALKKQGAVIKRLIDITLLLRHSKASEKSEMPV